MTPAARLLLGVAIGACATLFAHPASRPYMTGLLPRKDVQTLARGGDVEAELKNPPETLLDAGLWMHLAAAKSMTRRRLSQEELDSVILIASNAAKVADTRQNGTNNAFWHQMSAVFHDLNGDPAEARQSWTIASHRSNWSDLQSEKLVLSASEMGGQNGTMGWHLASAYHMRSVAATQAILRYARRSSKAVPMDTRDGLNWRVATLRNGALISNGAGSVATALIGARVSDLASDPGNFGVRPSQKAREDAHKVFEQNLRSVGMTLEADEAFTVFRENQSRPVISDQFNPKSNVSTLSISAVLAATVVGAMLFLVPFGMIAWGIGSLALRSSFAIPAFGWPTVGALATLLGSGVYLVTLLPLAAAVAFLCSLFLGFSPRLERKRFSDLGPTFKLTVFVLSFLFFVAASLFLVGLSTPARVVLPFLDLRPEFYAGSAPLLGLTSIIFSLLLLVAPMWALARRIRTPLVLGHTLRRFGVLLTVAGLGGSVLMAPVAVYADARLRTVLSELVTNEPVHYYYVRQ